MSFLALVETQADLAGMLREMRSISGVRRVVPYVPERVAWNALPSGLQRVGERLVESAARGT